MKPRIAVLTIGVDDLDAAMQQAERAGATIVKRAQDRFWGGDAGHSMIA